MIWILRNMKIEFGSLFLSAELALPYEAQAIDVTKLTQREPWFTAINPNGRIPALVDPNQADQPVFESGVISCQH